MKVTTIIPCYNAAKYIAKTIESVAAQTFPVTEILVVDDGSSDGSAKIASETSPLVRVITQDNAGESRARNVGISEAKTEYVAFLDADDIWDKNKLELQVSAMRRTNTVSCLTGFYNFGAFNNAKIRPQGVDSSVSVEDILVGFETNMSTPLIKLSECPRFDESVRHGEDTLFLMDVVRNCKTTYLNIPLVGYRRHNANQSRNPSIAFHRYIAKRNWIDMNSADEQSLLSKHHLINDTVYRDILDGAYYSGRIDQYTALASLTNQFAVANSMIRNAASRPIWRMRLKNVLARIATNIFGV